jgi:hypothetical protein
MQLSQARHFACPLRVGVVRRENEAKAPEAQKAGSGKGSGVRRTLQSLFSKGK